MTNLEKYKSDLEKLISKGYDLHSSIQHECFPERYKQEIMKTLKSKKAVDEAISKLHNFGFTYQTWYSEAKAIVKQLLPDRLNDFVKLYEKPKSRKNILFSNYVIEDYLQGVRVTTWDKEVVVDASAAIPQFRQQLFILESVRKRFESSLFEIKQLVQADLLDSELEVANELLKNKFLRAAGAVAGVVLEKHLNQVVDNHAVVIKKKDPTISEINDALKKSSAIDLPQWRFIQHLGDLRNLCDHDKKKEPLKEQVQDLIDGTAKITKTYF